MRAHPQIGLGGLHADIYNEQNAPWVRENGIDEGLRHVYRVNRPLILETFREGQIESVYNFPVTNQVTVGQLMAFANEVYNRQNTAFKLNVNFGYILRHRDTGEVRYFRPFEHEGLFETPIYISSRLDLKKLLKKIQSIDLMDTLMRQRPDTKWTVELLTNVRFSVFKTTFLLGCSDYPVPEYVKNNRAIYSLASDNRTGKVFQDNLCAFRCLSLHKGYSLSNLEGPSKQYFSQWKKFKGLDRPFQGLMLHQDMPDFESCFHLNVEVYSIDKEGTAGVEYRSMGAYDDTMYLNLSDNHLSFIHNFKLYARKYRCKFCELIWNSAKACKRHESSCENKEKYIFPGGFHTRQKFMFDILRDLEIHTNDENYPWFIVYDFESIQPRVESHGNSSKIELQRKHLPISVSVCSNVSPFKEPKCFINPDSDRLIKDMLDYMREIQAKAFELARSRWENVVDALSREIEDLTQKERAEDDTETRGLTKEDDMRKKTLTNAFSKFQIYMRQIPVLGFNASRFDINLVKEKLLLHLKVHENKPEWGFIVKKCNSYVCISNEHFRFLDISQYLAPGHSYASFLKAYEVEETKGFFPYLWFDDTKKLEWSHLPQRKDFFNDLRNEELSESDYENCKKVWEELEMKTFRDYVVWYNNLDVGPFVKAVSKMQNQYFEIDLDVFKTAISLPGLSKQILFDFARKNNAHFSLIDKRNADLYQTMRNNVVGGPSVIFHRQAEKGKSLIRQGKTCQKVIGYDCNSLYLWALDQELPVGIFVRRRAENQFRPEIRDIYIQAYAWLDYLNLHGGTSIRHYRNAGYEKRIGPYPVDGYDETSKTVYQFMGCYHHGHLCNETKNVTNRRWLEERTAKFDRTKDTTTYIQGKGFAVVEMWECEFKLYRKQHPEVNTILERERPDFCRRYKKAVTQDQLIQGVKDDVLFGYVECDIEVPQSWGKGYEHISHLPPQEYFREMSPIFCTSEIPFEVIGSHMQKYAEKMQLGKNSRTLLVGGMRAKQILLATPLLKWYIDNGIQVTKIYQVVEYQRSRCFAGLADVISDARREGDVNPNKKILADTNKNIGNNCFGYLLMDKSKHTDIVFFKGHLNASQAINQPNFRKLTCLNEKEAFYEVEFAKKYIRLDLPIQVSQFVLGLAKLRMLQFHYSCVDKYLQRADYQLLEMDTDSSYLALSAPSFEELVKPHLRGEFLAARLGHCKDGRPSALHFFPRSCCEKHSRYDKRVPGLFKTEYVGDEMYSLSSKCYFVNNATEKTFKLSCKGVNKRLVDNPLQIFRGVLQNQEPKNCENKGIMLKGNSLYTYKQTKLGFNYFYVKRRVLEDGVSTEPLDLTLTPAKLKLETKTESQISSQEVNL